MFIINIIFDLMIMSQRGELNSQPVDKMLEFITENKVKKNLSEIDLRSYNSHQAQHKPLSTHTAPH